MNIRNRIRELRHVPASELRPSPRNWRTHPQAQRDALRGVLAEIGYADACIARELPDGTLELIDGHLRAETTPDMEVPVLVTDLTEDEAAKVLATLDPLAAMAEADSAKLDALLREVQTESEAVANMLTELAESSGILEGATEVTEDEVPEPPAKPVTKPGDLWLLGEHRLLCGDSTKAEDVGRVMGGEKADLCFTSPPYGQQRDYDSGGVGDWDDLMCGVFGNLPMEDAGQVLVNLGLIHRDGEWVPYWDAWIEWMREQGWRRFGWYVWDQGESVPGAYSGRLPNEHEWVFHFVRTPQQAAHLVPCKHAGKVVTATGMHEQDGSQTAFSATVSTHKPRGSVAHIPPAKGGAEGHPAPFPVAFVSYFVESWKGNIYDPFLGSGTTLIAAEQLHRRCFGIEISPAYCDVIVKRWETLTGKKAKLKTTRKKKSA